MVFFIMLNTVLAWKDSFQDSFGFGDDFRPLLFEEQLNLGSVYVSYSWYVGTRVVDPHYFWKLDPDLLWSEKLGKDPH